MRKIFSIVLILVLVFSLTACANSTVLTYSTYWGRENVNEVCVYDVMVSKGEEVVNAPRLEGAGTYTTTITGSNSEGFTATTVFEFVGAYTIPGGSKEDVIERIETKVVFDNAANSFAPKSSERKYSGSTIVFKDGTYTLAPLKYTSTVSYNGEKSNVNLSVDGGSASFGLPESFEIKTKGKAFDNEQLPFVLRAMISEDVYEKGLGSSVSLVSALSKELLTVNVSVPSKTTEAVEIMLNGEKKPFDLYKLTLQKSGNNGGSPVYYYFAKGDMVDGNNKTRLIGIEQSIAYTNDTLLFALKEYTNA